MSRREYSDLEKAEALAALDSNGGNVAKTCRQLGLSQSTLRSWNDGRGINDDVTLLRAGKTQDLADRWEQVAHILIDALPGKVQSASLKDTATAAAIAVDKMQLLRGEPTAINEERADADSARERIARDIARIAARGKSDGAAGGSE